MSDRMLIISGLIVGLVTLAAVVAGSDGVIDTSEAQIITAFVAGAGLAVLVFTGKKPKL